MFVYDRIHLKSGGPRIPMSPIIYATDHFGIKVFFSTRHEIGFFSRVKVGEKISHFKRILLKW